MCRTTAYSEGRQTKILTRSATGFICISIQNKMMPAHTSHFLQMSVDQITHHFNNRNNLLTLMKTSLTIMKRILFAAFALVAFSQCTEEEIVPTQITAAPVEEAASSAEAVAGSFTITGIFTKYESVADCKTCTFFVPADLTEIDGKELNLTAGSVICLDKAIKYGDLTFNNLEGTEQNPITIGATIRK